MDTVVAGLSFVLAVLEVVFVVLEAVGLADLPPAAAVVLGVDAAEAVWLGAASALEAGLGLVADLATEAVWVPLAGLDAVGGWVLLAAFDPDVGGVVPATLALPAALAGLAVFVAGTAVVTGGDAGWADLAPFVASGLGRLAALVLPTGEVAVLLPMEVAEVGTALAVVGVAKGVVAVLPLLGAG